MKRILVFFTDDDGHEMTYGRSFLAHGVDPPLIHVAYPQQKSRVLEQFGVSSSLPATPYRAKGPGSSTSPARMYQKAKAASSIAARQNCDAVVCFTGEELAPARPFLPPGRHRFRGEWIGVFHRCNFAYRHLPLTRRLKGILQKRLMMLASWDKVFFLDANALLHYRQSGGRRASLLPDPISCPAADRDKARSHFHIPSGQTVFGTVGALSRRHGVIPFLRAFSEARLPASCSAHLYGRLQDHLEDEIRSNWSPLLADGRIRLFNRFLSDEEFDMAIASLDVAVAPFVGHTAISSFVLRCAMLRIPILASPEAWIGAFVRSFQLGQVLPSLDPGPFAGSIKEMGTYSRACLSPKTADELIRWHEPAHLSDYLTGQGDSAEQLKLFEDWILTHFQGKAWKR